jgi:hypothetical protein
MHPSKYLSVRYVLVLDLMFIKLYSCSQCSLLPNSGNINETFFHVSLIWCSLSCTVAHNVHYCQTVTTLTKHVFMCILHQTDWHSRSIIRSVWGPHNTRWKAVWDLWVEHPWSNVKSTLRIFVQDCPAPSYRLSYNQILWHSKLLPDYVVQYTGWHSSLVFSTVDCNYHHEQLMPQNSVWKHISFLAVRIHFCTENQTSADD